MKEEWFGKHEDVHDEPDWRQLCGRIAGTGLSLVGAIHFDEGDAAVGESARPGHKPCS